MRSGETLRERYELRELIASGGMGAVWRAFDLRLQRDVAIKAGGRDTGGPSLLEEGRAAALLDHPNIVTVHDVDTHEGEPFIVMEYVPGPSLRARLSEHGPLPEAEAVRLGIEVLKALDYAHSRGVWHNDVKPENILLGPNRAARLTDFGIASVQAPTIELTTGRPLFGTVAYLPPEVLAGAPPGPSADLHATAITIYECVAGAAPSRVPTEDGAPPFRVPALRDTVPHASAVLDAVLAQALDPSPGRRLQSAAGFHAALEPVLHRSHPTVPLAPRATYAPGHRVARRRMAALAAVAAVGSLAVAGVAWSQYGSTTGGHPAEDQARLLEETPPPTEPPTLEPTPRPTLEPTPLPTITPEAEPEPTQPRPLEEDPGDDAGAADGSDWWRPDIGDWSSRAWDGIAGLPRSLWDQVFPPDD